MSTATIDSDRLKAALEKATTELLAQRNAQGFWEGELSSSALSTATAVTALALAHRHGTLSNPETTGRVQSGLKWLAANQNADGGWGDTTKSLSNISTTTLCWAAFGAAAADDDFPDSVKRAERWLTERAGSLAPDQLAAAILARYGKDRTFSVPILTMCALAGRLGPGSSAWRHVIPLPFELAAFPHSFFAALRLPVVSYALPALIAIGQARHVHAPSRNPLARLIRNATRQKTLRKLTELQPENGGFLEATPLTSFVTMSLVASGQAGHLVARRGVEFLGQSQRADGSWPIDTNLSTWCTTLAVDALPLESLTNPRPSIDWLLRQQYRVRHPYTHAAPGGWAWTDLPGGVPDADDTSGALVALAKLRPVMNPAQRAECLRAVELGIQWLIDLQNRDGGIPTFCRGWGALPFDQSSADITAHAIRAWLAWRDSMPPSWKHRMHRALKRAMRFLVSQQGRDGAFLPLWFGNQHAAGESNRSYGTARVLLALADWERSFGHVRHDVGTCWHLGMALEAVGWLLQAQHFDGGWSGDFCREASIEETALAIHALAESIQHGLIEERSELRGRTLKAVALGVDWMVARVASGAWREPSPIGFYFAKLWYYERLYPMIFTVGALRAAAEVIPKNEESGGPKTTA